MSFSKKFFNLFYFPFLKFNVVLTIVKIDNKYVRILYKKDK